jgi:hypothetical protein
MSIILTTLALAWPYIAGALGVIAVIFQQRRAGAKAERAKQRAKEADAYEEHLRDIANAANAGNRVDPHGMSDDKYNRDRNAHR